MRKRMGSILAMLNLTFNPRRHLREITKVGSWLGKTGGPPASGRMTVSLSCTVWWPWSLLWASGSSKMWERLRKTRVDFFPLLSSLIPIWPFPSYALVSPFSNRSYPCCPFHSILLSWWSKRWKGGVDTTAKRWAEALRQGEMKTKMTPYRKLPVAKCTWVNWYYF